jgi:hypothetical protein
MCGGAPKTTPVIREAFGCKRARAKKSWKVGAGGEVRGERRVVVAGEPAQDLVQLDSPLITKYDPRIFPASFDFWVANLKSTA